MDATRLTTEQTLADLWAQLDLPQEQLKHTSLSGAQEALPSSFQVTQAAQSSIAAAASAACLIGNTRAGETFTVAIDSLAAALECTSYFTIDGNSPPMWADYSGVYEARNGYLRVHANFDHHRDCFLQALGLEQTGREAAEQAARHFDTDELDQTITRLGGACAALRTMDQWNQLPQAQAIASQPLISITRIADAPPIQLADFNPSAGALGGVRVLDLTRILAGPVCGRTLAAYGADVMLVNSPTLPNIESIIETSRGKLSTHCDLTTSDGKQSLNRLLQDTHIFVQGYRPGALAQLGFDAPALCRELPGLIAVSLSAYGNSGPWSDKRGFDSLVQTATGFNAAEADAYQQTQPKPLPVQILDYATGFLMAYGAQAALYRQLTEGGSYHVEVSLARTALWVKQMGQSGDHLSLPMPDPLPYAKSYDSLYGDLIALPHAAVFDNLPNGYHRPSAAPGTHRPQWPA
ncbi:MAG: CoA transferase [Pseudomonadota bacterium]